MRKFISYILFRIERLSGQQSKKKKIILRIETSLEYVPSPLLYIESIRLYKIRNINDRQ